MAGVWYFLPRGVDVEGGEMTGGGAREEAKDQTTIEGRGSLAEDADAEGGANVVSENFRKSERGDAGSLPDPQGERAAMKAMLREARRRDDDGLFVETMPDGSGSIHLQGRFQHVTSLVENAEGEMVPMCGEHVAEAEVEKADR